MYAGLTSGKELAGVLALSTWLPLHKNFPGIFKFLKDDREEKMNNFLDIIKFDFSPRISHRPAKVEQAFADFPRSRDERSSHSVSVGENYRRIA